MPKSTLTALLKLRWFSFLNLFAEPEDCSCCSWDVKSQGPLPTHISLRYTSCACVSRLRIFHALFSSHCIPSLHPSHCISLRKTQPRNRYLPSRQLSLALYSSVFLIAYSRLIVFEPRQSEVRLREKISQFMLCAIILHAPRILISLWIIYKSCRILATALTDRQKFSSRSHWYFRENFCEKPSFRFSHSRPIADHRAASKI